MNPPPSDRLYRIRSYGIPATGMSGAEYVRKMFIAYQICNKAWPLETPTTPWETGTSMGVLADIVEEVGCPQYDAMRFMTSYGQIVYNEELKLW